MKLLNERINQGLSLVDESINDAWRQRQKIECRTNFTGWSNSTQDLRFQKIAVSLLQDFKKIVMESINVVYGQKP